RRQGADRRARKAGSVSAEDKKKPSFWDRLLGREAESVLMREPEPEEPAAPPPEAPAEPEPHQTYEPDDAGPPETQAEWIEAGIADAPEPEPDTPETVWDPFDARPENLQPQAEEPAPEPEPEPVGVV